MSYSEEETYTYFQETANKFSNITDSQEDAIYSGQDDFQGEADETRNVLDGFFEDFGDLMKDGAQNSSSAVVRVDIG